MPRRNRRSTRLASSYSKPNESLRTVSGKIAATFRVTDPNHQMHLSMSRMLSNSTARTRKNAKIYSLESGRLSWRGNDDERSALLSEVLDQDTTLTTWIRNRSRVWLASLRVAVDLTPVDSPFIIDSLLDPDATTTNNSYILPRQDTVG